MVCAPAQPRPPLTTPPPPSRRGPDRIGQQFWGVRYIDDAVARRVNRDTGTSTAWSDDPADNFYYLTDVMFSVRAVTDSTGLLHTRLDYTPYGVAMHGFAADANGDGAVTVSDLGVVSANHNSGDELKPGDTGYDPDAFLDGGDEIDVSVFLTRYSPYVSGGSNPTFNAGWIDNPSDPNGPDNSVGYDGYWFDLAGATESTSTGLYMVRHRVYAPKLGRWLQRDPAGYVDGFNTYGYARSAPIVLTDPSGLKSGGNKNGPIPVLSSDSPRYLDTTTSSGSARLHSAIGHNTSVITDGSLRTRSVGRANNNSLRITTSSSLATTTTVYSFNNVSTTNAIRPHSTPIQTEFYIICDLIGGKYIPRLTNPIPSLTNQARNRGSASVNAGFYRRSETWIVAHAFAVNATDSYVQITASHGSIYHSSSAVNFSVGVPKSGVSVPIQLTSEVDLESQSSLGGWTWSCEECSIDEIIGDEYIDHHY